MNNDTDKLYCDVIDIRCVDFRVCLLLWNFSEVVLLFSIEAYYKSNFFYNTLCETSIEWNILIISFFTKTLYIQTWR